MKYLLPVFMLVLWASCNTTQGPRTSSTTPVAPPQRLEYDSTHAASLGADDYGMKSYIMAFLYRGSNTITDTAVTNKLQRAHLDNIQRMAKAGDLVLAGPFLDNAPLRGIYIFNTQSLDTAKAWTESDPAIQQNWLRMELKPWYGSAALMELNDRHKLVAKKGI